MTVIYEVQSQSGSSTDGPLAEEEGSQTSDNRSQASDVHPVRNNDAQALEASMQEEAVRLQRASDAMLLPDGSAFGDVQSDISRQLHQVDFTDSVQESNSMLQEMIDPKFLDEQFYAPMRRITAKVMQVLEQITPGDLGAVAARIEAARELRNFGEEQRVLALENVYKCAQKQMEQYGSAVEARNRLVRESFTQVLQMYEARMEAESNARCKLLALKQKEHGAVLKASRQMDKYRLECGKVSAEVAKIELATQAKKDELSKEKKRRAVEREAKKKQDKLQLEHKREMQQQEKQQKEVEKLLQKAKIEMEQARRRDASTHDKGLKDLELKARKGTIDWQAFAALKEELEAEMASYNAEFQLAEESMRAEIENSRMGCHVSHSAPKIEWGLQAPRVVPGSVSWGTSS